jgi:hypothetical protein
VPKNDPRRPETAQEPRKREEAAPDPLEEARRHLAEEGVPDPSERVVRERAGQD